jgi:hypothetical protein
MHVTDCGTNWAVRGEAAIERETLFISKATPEDDDFVLWLAPRLEAAGYNVFADILSLEPGDRWRKRVTGTLQDQSIKMLLCCRDSTLSKNGVQEEIAIAEDLAKELKDDKFIIPLRLEPFRKLFGIGGLQYIDFIGSWAQGLRELLESLERQSIPRSAEKIVINPNWETYRKRLATKIKESPELLTTNWLRIATVPETIRYYQPTGAVDHSMMQTACKGWRYPAELYLRGFFSFAAPEEIESNFANVGKFSSKEYELPSFLEKGIDSPDVRPREARNLVSSMFRKSWEGSCYQKSLYAYPFSSQTGFHVTDKHVALGRRVPWGHHGERRSSMLQNVANGRIWRYGVSASPQFWPYAHFKLKARVLFAEFSSGTVLENVDQQHRLRRTICKGWRNKQWHGRLMAFLELLSNNSSYIDLSLSDSSFLRLDASPIRVTAPVTTPRLDEMGEDAEEADSSTLGNPDIDDEDE